MRDLIYNRSVHLNKIPAAAMKQSFIPYFINIGKMKKTVLLLTQIIVLLSTISSITFTQSWTQLGNDIDGETADSQSGFSVSLSSDGSRVAIGAINNDGNGDTSGHVRIFYYSGGTWTQLGSDIDGEAAFNWSGWSVSLSSDGSRVAIGALYNDGNGNDSGHVRIFYYSGGTWTQLGSDIDGEAAGDISGLSVSLSSDGSRVAIGAYLNDGNGDASGHVRVYDYNGVAWTQLGDDIDGEAAGDESGRSVSLSSDGSRVAIGAVLNDGNGDASGHVRVYELISGTWTKLGSDIDGEATLDFSGTSVSLSSDGSRVAIGANGNDANGNYSGHVRVYNYSGVAWTKLGSDIDGEATFDNSGNSVSLSSDGSRVAIGAKGNGGNGNMSGHVRVYKYSGGTWTQLSDDINGEAADDQSGWSVSLSSDGSRVAIGAPDNDGNGSNSGHVRVYYWAPEINLKQSSTNIADGGSYDYGSKVSGTATDVVFTIENTGTADLTLTTPLTLGGANADQFSIQAQPTSPIAASGSTPFTVRFSPTSAGAKTATIAIANNDSDENPYDLTLNGTGLAPEINLKQSSTNIADGGSYDYGSKVSGTATDVVFTIENPGTADLTLTTPLTLGGANAGQFSIQTQPTSPVVPSGSTTFTVRFLPTSAGAKTASIAIANNDSDENPYDLTLNGTGLAPEINLKQSSTDIADDGSYDYGSKTSGSATDVVFTIENTGTAALTLTTPLTLGGVDAGQFSIQTQPTSPIAASGSTTFTVRFSPTSIGAKTATIAIANNDGTENPYDLTLNGTGLIFPYIIISGYVKYNNGDAVEGVAIAFSNGGGTVTSDVDGDYHRYITRGWSGTATPSMTGLSFNPSSYTYSGVSTNQNNQDYIASSQYVYAHIFGYIKDINDNPLEGVKIEYSNSGQFAITDAIGYYKMNITEGWNGTATPSMTNYSFEPSQYTYSNITGYNYNQDFVGTDLTLAVNDVSNSLPTEFTVLPAYPNPFNPSTTIRYGLVMDSKVTVQIYDISGQLISTLLNSDQPQGWHSIIWNGTNKFGEQVPAGLYLSKITSDNEVKTTKLMLLK